MVTLRGAGLLLPRAQVFTSYSDRISVPEILTMESKDYSISSVPTTEEDTTVNTTTTAVAGTTEEKYARDRRDVARGSDSYVRLRSEEQRVWWRLSVEDPCACLGMGGESIATDSDRLIGGSSGVSGRSGSDGFVGGVMMINDSDQVEGDLGVTLSLDTQLRTFRALERAAR